MSVFIACGEGLWPAMKQEFLGFTPGEVQFRNSTSHKDPKDGIMKIFTIKHCLLIITYLFTSWLNIPLVGMEERENTEQNRANNNANIDIFRTLLEHLIAKVKSYRECSGCNSPRAIPLRNEIRRLLPIIQSYANDLSLTFANNLSLATEKKEGLVVDARPQKTVQFMLDSLLIQDVAAQKTHSVNLLLTRGANPNCNTKFTMQNKSPHHKDGPFFPILFIAILQNSNDIVKLLLHHGADADFCNYDTLTTPLTYAIILQREDTVRALVLGNQRASMSALNDNLSPTCFATLIGAITIVDILLKASQTKQGPRFNASLLQYETGNSIGSCHPAASSDSSDTENKEEDSSEEELDSSESEENTDSEHSSSEEETYDKPKEKSILTFFLQWVMPK